MPKSEFSKKLIIIDYLVLFLLCIATIIFAGVIDLTPVCVAWIAQVGVSTGFYFWKAKNENRVKIPLQVIKTLRPSIRKELDLNQIITTIIEKE